MQVATESGERLICAILAAQMTALRDRMDSGVPEKLLWGTVDAIGLLSTLVKELAARTAASDTELTARCEAALSTASEISRSLEDQAFHQAQTHDLTCQIASSVTTALSRLSDAQGSPGPGFTQSDLTALYVTEDQRRVHETTVEAFASRSLAPHDCRTTERRAG